MLASWIRSLTGRRKITLPIRIASRKSAIAARRMTTLPLSAQGPGQLLIPLADRPGVPACAAVKPGDRIRPYSPLNRPDRGQVPLFSPAPAVVEELTTIDTQHAADLPAVRLRVTEWPAIDLDQLASESDAASRPAEHDDLPAILDELGITIGYTGRPVQAGDLLRQAATQHLTRVVVNAIQSEPALASHQRLVLDAPLAVAAGARAIADHLSLRHWTLLVSSAQRIPPAVSRQIRRHRGRILAVRTSYPGDADTILSKNLFNETSAPAGRTAMAEGNQPIGRHLLLPADAIWRIGMALLHRRPVTLQPVTLAGSCLKPIHQGTYLVPIGLTIASLAAALRKQQAFQHPPRTTVLGGPMAGAAVTQPQRTIIDPATQAVLFVHQCQTAEPTACIRCGWCTYGCPVGLDPIAILDNLEARRMALLTRLGVEQCLDCGVCSYLCPSHLPLAQAARTAKSLLGR